MTNQFELPRGLICVTTYGSIRVETAQSLTTLVRHLERRGMRNIDVSYAVATLVDKARNEAVQEVLKSDPKDGYQWLWFLDADMKWEPTLGDIMLQTAFHDLPVADIVGGYAQLRGSPFLPTIDTGTGTWEPHQPMQGPIEVIRTGSACILIKRHVLEKMRPPWYGVRPVPGSLEMITEFDNYARIKYDGRNPFAQSKEWDALVNCAVDESVRGVSRDYREFTSVGEDSNFCDRAKALGFRIFVQTHAVCTHIHTKEITPEDHVRAMKENAESADRALGVTRG